MGYSRERDQGGFSSQKKPFVQSVVPWSDDRSDSNSNSNASNSNASNSSSSNSGRYAVEGTKRQTRWTDGRIAKSRMLTVGGKTAEDHFLERFFVEWYVALTTSAHALSYTCSIKCTALTENMRDCTTRRTFIRKLIYSRIRGEISQSEKNRNNISKNANELLTNFSHLISHISFSPPFLLLFLKIFSILQRGGNKWMSKLQICDNCNSIYFGL